MMTIQKIITLFFLGGFILPVIGQEYNPFERFDKDIEVLTFSNGKYNEFFDTDSIEIIGSALLNTKTMKVIGFIDEEVKYSESSLEPEVVSRWLSVDPLARQFPFYSPYHFAGNKPIVAIDLEGLEDIYYGARFENNGSAMILIHNSTKINQDLDEAFMNTDPNQGPVNIGWDMLIVKTKTGDASGYTRAIDKSGLESVLGLDGFSNPYPELEGYKDLVKKIYYDDAKKGLILININENDVNIADENAAIGSWNAAGDVSATLTHEKRIHAMAHATDTKRDQRLEHQDYFYDFDAEYQWGAAINSPDKLIIRLRFPNSQAGFDVRATDQTVNDFNTAGKNYLQRVQGIKAQQIGVEITNKQLATE